MEVERGTIYELHVADVYKFLLFYIGNHEDAEDLTQDTFVKAFNKWKQYEYRSSVKTWLLTIARNLAIDRIRKRKRSIMFYMSLRDEPYSTTHLPEEMANSSELKRELYKAIQSLKPDYRAVVVLRGIQELSSEEAALILGWAQNKVNVKFHRALKILQNKLSMKEGEDLV